MPRERPDRVVVISDLHMGADPARGIFTAQDQLANFIRHVAAAPERVEIVVLGDSIDYLQVKPFLAFDAAIAKLKTEAIIAHNQGVFDAFRDFVAAGKRLVWCMGNHDLELVFEGAQQALVRAIVDANDPSSRARLELRLDGGRLDYPLPRGGVLRLVHGNKEDPWNKVDYDELAAVAKTLMASGGADNTLYPPGSRLVAEVLNPLKEEGFVHVDLLKPEATVAVPLTLALWPASTRERLKSAFPLFFSTTAAKMKERLERFWTGKRKRFGRSVPAPEVVLQPEDLLALALRDAFAIDDTVKPDNLATLLGQPNGPKAVSDAITAAPPPGKNFGGSWAKDFASQALRGAAHNANRVSDIWSLEEPDELDEPVRGAIADGAIVVIAGHTHLARAVSYDGGYYLNTGTWANLMRIPAYFRGAAFHEHARSLKEYLEKPKEAPAELRPFQRLTYADVDLRGSGFRAELREWISEPSRAVGRFP